MSNELFEFENPSKKNLNYLKNSLRNSSDKTLRRRSFRPYSTGYIGEDSSEFLREDSGVEKSVTFLAETSDLNPFFKKIFRYFFSSR
jgi:hypothetical protein